MRSGIKRLAVFGVVLAAGGLTGGAAAGLLGQETSHGGPGVDVPANPEVGAPSSLIGRLQHGVAGAEASIWDLGENYLGLGGVRPGPTPGPTPGLHPENYVNAAIQALAGAGADVGRGLGGVVVGPIPAPTPGIEPDPGGRNTRVVNSAIRTVGKTVEDAALGLGGVVVGPIPAPTPGLLPVPELP